MDSNLKKAIGLAVVIMIAWNFYYYHRYKDVIERNSVEQAIEKEREEAKKKREALSDKEMKADVPPTAAEPVVEPTAPTTDASVSAEPTSPTVTASVSGAEPKLITVDTGVSRVSLSNVGGVITSWQLTHFADRQGETIDMVNDETELRPLAAAFATPEATSRISTALFATTSPETVTLGPGNETAEVRFDYAMENGFKLSKKLVFHHNSYVVDVDVLLTQPGAGLTGTGFGITWPGLSKDTDSIYSYIGPVLLKGKERVAEAVDEDEKAVYEGNISWAGLTNMYYFTAFIPETESAKVTYEWLAEKSYSATLRMEAIDGSAPNRFSLYVGPKKSEELAQTGHDLGRIIDYGWFDVLAKPLFKALMWFYHFTGNFGWSIIIITVIIKIIFFPLSQKSFKSMEKMKILQPQMKILQERYKNDKAKMNEELIALYRKHQVNPLSGCLPMLLQIPVFIALYKVLLESIELKGAPFMLWLTDLSVKDPYYVTPLLMGASMFLQQKLSPAATDPVQRNLMLMMPLIFTVMFLNFPSGLVVYWLVNNLLSIAQQYYISRQVKTAR